MTHNTGSIKIVREYIKKYPDMKDYTLAKLIYKEHPQLFSSFDTARGRVRYARGHMGNKHRACAVKDFQTPLNYDTRATFVDFKSLAPKLKRFNLPTSIRKVLFLSDIHLPYQDNEKLFDALEYGVKEEVDCVWLNGDIMDMFQVSDHEKLPNKADINYEFDLVRDFMQRLRKLFPKAVIYYKEGNHERRWLRYLMRKAPEVIGMPEFQLPIILNLNFFDIHWVSNETLCKFGKLNVIHGNEFKGGGGVHPARTLYNKAKTDIVAGDKHKSDMSITTDLDGKVTQVYSVGCLCDLNPEYFPMGHMLWNHGFAIIELKDKD